MLAIIYFNGAQIRSASEQISDLRQRQRFIYQESIGTSEKGKL